MSEGSVRLVGPAAGGRAAPLAACGAASAALAVFVVPFAAFASLVLYHFYIRGSFVLDSGLQAFLLSHGGLLLSYPAALGGGSYLRSHVVPIFVGLWLVRQALPPVSDVQFFAVFIGLASALPGLGVFWALRSGYGLRGPLLTAAAALIAIVFSFNGLALAIARYPHFEMLLVGSTICFAVALVRGRLVAAGLFFALALATREDAGFHLFGLLFVLVAVNRWYDVPWRAQRAELGFAAVGLVYSLVLVSTQSTLANGPSALAQTYIGAPPFVTLTLATVAGRLFGYLAFRAYIVLPAIIAIWWAMRTRNPYILVGYVAFVPWGLLQLVARSDIAGTLSGYYGFPFMIASFWPLVGVLLFDRRGSSSASGRPVVPVAAFAAMIAASFVGIAHQYNPGALDLPAAFLAADAVPSGGDGPRRGGFRRVRARARQGRRRYQRRRAAARPIHPGRDHDRARRGAARHRRLPGARV